MKLKIRANVFSPYGFDELLLLILLFLIINPVSYSRISPFILIGLSIVWLLFANIVSPQSFSRSVTNKLFVATMVYPFLLLLYSLRSNVLFEMKSFMECVIIFIFLYCINRKNHNTIEKVQKFVFFYLIVIAAYTSCQLLSNPLISRMMAGSADKYGNFLTGGYNTVYGIMLLSLAVLGVIRQSKAKYKFLPIFVLFSIFILLSQYTTAFLLLLLGVIMIVFEKNKKLRNFLLLFLIASIIFVILFPEIVSRYILSLAHLFPSEAFQRYRMEQLAEMTINFNNGNYDSATMEGTVSRVDLYRVTMNTIGNNFFLGAGNADRALIGGHATFLDVIAKFGIICGGAYVFTKLYLIRKISQMIPYIYSGYYRMIGIIYVVLSLLNTTDDMMISTIIFVIIPFFFLLNDFKKDSSDRIISKEIIS